MFDIEDRRQRQKSLMFVSRTQQVFVASDKNLRPQRQKSSSSATKIVLCALGFIETVYIFLFYAQPCILNSTLLMHLDESPRVQHVILQFPKIGELILRRLILQFRRAYRRNDKVPIAASFL